MNSLPDVTVVMSVYNGADRLRETVESVLSQQGVSLEFIIVDDGSTDRTDFILADYARHACEHGRRRCDHHRSARDNAAVSRVPAGVRAGSGMGGRSAGAPMAASAALIQERTISFPSESRGQSFIETIRFAGANRLLVEIDYRDQKGSRSTRAIEAYSLRRSKAGDVLLMAVRAEDGQPRSYLMNSILGVTPTQRTFSPRYPIELTPTGFQVIPETSRSAGTYIARTSTRRRSRASSSGPTYVYRCTVCRKIFQRKNQDSTLRPHKNPAGFQCYGTCGTFVRTK